MAGLCFSLSILCLGIVIMFFNVMSKTDWAWTFEIGWNCLFYLLLMFYFLRGCIEELKKVRKKG